MRHDIDGTVSHANNFSDANTVLVAEGAAQHANGAAGKRHDIQRIDAVFRRNGCVRGSALDVNELGQKSAGRVAAEQKIRLTGNHVRMRCDGGVDVIKRAAQQQLRLSAAACGDAVASQLLQTVHRHVFLTWYGEKYGAAGESRGNFRLTECQGSTGKRGQLHVMPAGVRHAGFGYGERMFRTADAVQFADQADGGSGAAERCLDAGVGKSGLHVQPARLQPIRDFSGGAVLGIAKLRVGIYIFGKSNELLRVCVNAAANALFCFVHKKSSHLNEKSR